MSVFSSAVKWAGNLNRLQKLGIAITVAVTTLVGGYEGLRLKAYRDVVGVKTVCYGETRNVKLGDSYTPEECALMLRGRINEFATGLDKCLNVDPPAQVYMSVLSWSYNVGLGAACKSTLMKKLNKSDFRGACNELLKWNRAKGRTIKGLSIRRAAEREICLKGVK